MRVVVLVLQVPAPQRGVVIVRLCMPLSSQLSAYMPQALHAPGTGAPQELPSVLRAQGSLSMRASASQVPVEVHA